MRLVDHQIGAGRVRQTRRLLPIPLVGKHNPDVCQRRLGQHTRDVAMSKLALERSEIVELDNTRRHDWIDGGSDIAGLLLRHAILESNNRLVDRAVIAVIHDQHLRTPAQLTTRPQDPAVGIRRRQREGPLGHAETPSEIIRNPDRVLRRQHRRNPTKLANPVLNGGNGGVGRVAGHRARITKAEVDQFVAIDVGNAIALRRRKEDWVRPDPDLHPLHRHATDHVLLCLHRKRARFGVPHRRSSAFAIEQLVESYTVDGNAVHGVPLRCETRS